FGLEEFVETKAMQRYAIRGHVFPIAGEGGRMSTARNGDVEIYYEEFGDPSAPTLLLVNGLGSQCLNYDVAWCQLFCEEGFHVVRYDNRDVGLSTKLDGTDYVLTDMADDAIA